MVFALAGAAVSHASAQTAPATDPAFTTPAAVPASHASSEPPARRLNLYGELEETGPAAGSQLDGSTNLVQVSFATEGACVDPATDRTGTLMVFASTMHRRTSDIYLKTVNGKTLTQLTSDPSDDAMPAFSPEATKIAFASNRSGNWDIYLTFRNGSRTSSDVVARRPLAGVLPLRHAVRPLGNLDHRHRESRRQALP
jgi:TolB protein